MNSFLHIHIDGFNITPIDSGFIVQLKGEVAHAFKKVTQISWSGENFRQPWIFYGFESKLQVLNSYLLTPQAQFSGLLSICNFTTLDTLLLEVSYEDGKKELVSLLEMDVVVNRINVMQNNHFGIDNSDYRIALSGDATEAETVIILPTFQPDLGFLYEQVESILKQSYDNWHCLIVDDKSGEHYLDSILRLVGHDSRFTIIENKSNLGFYKNIEHALVLLKKKIIVQDCSYVALSDQDDVWYSEKLQKSVVYLKENYHSKLVFCDQEILDENLVLIQKSFWVNRSMNIAEIDKLMFKNYVTGAASVFEIGLLDIALPFPNTFGKMYHDHWLAVVAALVEGLAYIDESLYGYRQHFAQDTGFGDMVVDLEGKIKDHLSRLEKITATFPSITTDELSFDILVFDLLRLSVIARSLIAKTESQKVASENLERLEPFVLGQPQLLFNLCIEESKRMLTTIEPTSTIGEEVYFLASSFMVKLGDGIWRKIIVSDNP